MSRRHVIDAQRGDAGDENFEIIIAITRRLRSGEISEPSLCLSEGSHRRLYLLFEPMSTIK